MRRFVCLILGLLIVVCSGGCGSGDGDSVVVNPNATIVKTESPSQGTTEPSVPATAQAQDEGFYFESGGVKIHTYDLAQDVLTALGNPKGTFEAPSCAYQGVDKFYYYNGFQLTVNDVDNAAHVTVIMVVDDTVSIPQGVKIGSKQDEMLSLMGSDYTEASGVYQFVSGTTILQIRVKDGAVADIQYTYTPQQ